MIKKDLFLFNKMSRRSYSNYNNNRQGNINQQGQGNNRRDPFYDFDMCAAMDEFDDPFDNMFGGGAFRMPNIFQEAEKMMRGFHDEMRMIGDDNQRGGQLQARGANPGSFICKSYVSRVNYNNGQPEQEVYQSQSINQFGKDGHKIQEKQEAYKNSRTGIEKASHQRILDDRGQKCIRQRNRNTGESNEHNIYKGFEENELEKFNKEYNDYRQKSNFQNNYKLLNSVNQRFNGMIGDGARRGGYNNGPAALPSGNNNYERPGLPSGNNDNYQRSGNNNNNYQRQGHNRNNVRNPADYYNGK